MALPAPCRGQTLSPFTSNTRSTSGPTCLWAFLCESQAPPRPVLEPRAVKPRDPLIPPNLEGKPKMRLNLTHLQVKMNFRGGI